MVTSRKTAQKGRNRFISIQTIRRTEKFLYMRNRMKARIEDLEGFLYVLGCARNLVFVSKLDDLSFNLKIGDNVFSLFKDMYCYGSGTLSDSLYCFHLDAKFMESLVNVECVVGSKHCIKGKQTKQISKNSATRSNELLRLIHIDICGPFDGNKKYFITFVDDFSHYCYLYLLHEKSQSVDVLKVFIDEVQRQLDRKVKVVRSDRSGEFYGKYNEWTMSKSICKVP
ncbi:hypothetical protein CR513_46201, partial [Mucuna pruriens]